VVVRCRTAFPCTIWDRHQVIDIAETASEYVEFGPTRNLWCCGTFDFVKPVPYGRAGEGGESGGDRLEQRTARSRGGRQSPCELTSKLQFLKKPLGR